MKAFFRKGKKIPKPKNRFFLLFFFFVQFFFGILKGPGHFDCSAVHDPNKGRC
jgi:hypothetical protein